MTYEKPLPRPDADTKAFWEGCQRHELRFQKCRSCGHVRWPASILCPTCYSEETEWITASGRGKVYTFVVYHTAYHKAFASDLPYVTASIELEEGPRLLSNIVGCDPQEVRCDMDVEVTWEDINEEFSLPKFKPQG
ncbi:MAG: Zn-ribbon domain-containing OB-fold protein [Deltaproteobacteria bacterium]|nr:Zn-ribbon domain-containing OB-fold protein [Deltaproteobacteria bacterium]